MSTRPILRLSAAALLVAAALTGCANNHKDHASASAPAAGTMTMANTKCPYSNEPVNPSITSDYKGQKVGFCCAGCKGKWDGSTDAKRAEILAKTK
jgi:hypothetical protein